MFLGYQLKKIGEEVKNSFDEDGNEVVSIIDITEPFISHIAETKEELESLPCVTLDRIEETGVEYVLHNGEYKPKAEVDAELAKAETESRIAELKAKLVDTDYIAIKIAEGSATASEYADVIAQRKAWRKEINELESVDIVD